MRRDREVRYDVLVCMCIGMYVCNKMPPENIYVRKVHDELESKSVQTGGMHFFFGFVVSTFLCFHVSLNSMCLFCFARFFFFNLIRIQQSNIYFLEYLFWHDHQPEVKFPSNMMEIVFLNWIIWKLHENPKCGNVLHLILI